MSMHGLRQGRARAADVRAVSNGKEAIKLLERARAENGYDGIVREISLVRKEIESVELVDARVIIGRRRSDPDVQRFLRALKDEPSEMHSLEGVHVAFDVAGLEAAFEHTGELCTLWLRSGGTLAKHLPLPGVQFGMTRSAVREQLGTPSVEGKRWDRFDAGSVSTHFTFEGENELSLITLMSPNAL